MRGMANLKTYYDKGKGRPIVNLVKEMKGGGEDVLDDATILMYVEQIEAVYSAKALELAVVDGTATENEKTVDNKDGEVAEDDEEDEEDYDYNEWHDFVSRNCEWDDGKDEEGGAAGGQSGGRTNKSNVGVRGEVAPRKAVGGKTADQSRSNGGGSSGKKHGRDELKAKSSFEEYIDDGREYIVTSRSCLGGLVNMGQYSYSQPSVLEEYGEEISDCGYSSTEELIRRDQEELRINYGDPAQYPPQPEVEFGFPQTCYCGGVPKLATSKTLNDPG
ncbi:hypothetical protein Bca52824_027273 [Brassica carinata]|uniref:Uncharacterized protein n=1 Tax=Brassica carinata TaxID=52824 RepID=A0A8X7SKJ8_BRACI|nr:hypothetical protein Bca52824_027273 [Brassica carinata]